MEVYVYVIRQQAGANGFEGSFVFRIRQGPAVLLGRGDCEFAPSLLRRVLFSVSILTALCYTGNRTQTHQRTMGEQEGTGCLLRKLPSGILQPH